jgi:hypothetical protein
MVKQGAGLRDPGLDELAVKAVPGMRTQQRDALKPKQKRQRMPVDDTLAVIASSDSPGIAHAVYRAGGGRRAATHLTSAARPDRVADRGGRRPESASVQSKYGFCLMPRAGP